MATTETTTAPDTIQLKNLGPIVDLVIPVPVGGGISIVLGPNDCGKSLGLDGIGKMLGGKQHVSQRDGQPNPGEIRYGDVLLRVGKSTRVIGEAEVLSIEGRLSIADLVEPHIKDPVAADKARTKALCRLTGAVADPAVFYDAVGGRERFEAVVTASACDTDDLVDMQRMVKRDLDLAARKAEDTAKKADGAAKAAAAFIEGIDLEAPCDAAALQQTVEAAISVLQDLRSRKTAAFDAAARAEKATEAIDRALAEYQGPTVEDARTAVKTAQEAVAQAKLDEQQALEAYQRAQHVTSSANQLLALDQQAQSAAVNHAQTIAEWQATMEAGRVTGPTAEEIGAAEAFLNATRVAFEQGVLVRQALQYARHLDDAKALRFTAGIEAMRLRDAGRDTELVLAEVVSAEGLTLLDGRWCTEQPGRGKVFFADRSRGTRAAIAIGLVAKRLRELGNLPALVPYPQELWEGMDRTNRDKVRAACLELNINIVTGQCDHDTVGELRAEVYKPHGS